MANEARVTWFFGQAQTGWSETYWMPAGINSALYAKVTVLTAKRVTMLMANHTLLAVRITREGADRFTRLFLAGGTTTVDAGFGTIFLPGRGGEDGAGSNVEGPPDQVRAAMHMEVVKDGQRIGLRYLAGIPDDVSLTENPTLNKNLAKVWWVEYTAWRAQLLADGWAIKALDKGVAFPLVPVITYRLRTAAPSVIGAVIPDTVAWPTTPVLKVALQGVRMTRRGLLSPNGTWIQDGTEVDAGTHQRTVWLRATEGFDPTEFLTLGKIRAKSDSFVQPTWIEPIRVGVHKRGRPFGSPVGRRRTR